MTKPPTASLAVFHAAAALANAFRAGEAMTQRLELGMRFGELFSAPWE
jgi:hypothetical protein